MKKLLEEFKAFALKGNMVDLAVGMMIGSAFTSIVNSLVNDIFMPVLSLFTGKIDFTNMFIALDGGEYASLEAAKEAAAATLNYGAFITQTINFVLMAFVVFLTVKCLNRMSAKGKKEEPAAPAAPTEKMCPYCRQMIPLEAVRCPHCTSQLDEAQK